MSDEQAMRALVAAQIVVDRFARNASIQSVTMVPNNVGSRELGAWQAHVTAPQSNPDWLAAIAERDRCLEPLGFSVDEWLQRWERARAAQG